MKIVNCGFLTSTRARECCSGYTENTRNDGLLCHYRTYSGNCLHGEVLSLKPNGPLTPVGAKYDDNKPPGSKCNYDRPEAPDKCPEWAPTTEGPEYRFCAHLRRGVRCTADWSDYGTGDDTPPLGSKSDSGKPQWSLLPWRELNDVVRVLTMGAEKYSPDSWKSVKDGQKRYADSLMRHFTTWADGERADPESKITHLAHVVCCALFMMWFDTESDGGK